MPTKNGFEKVNCLDCVYWQPDPAFTRDENRKVIKNSSLEDGCCHRSRPMQHPGLKVFWPEVKSNDWCGEGRAR